MSNWLVAFRSKNFDDFPLPIFFYYAYSHTCIQWSLLAQRKSESLYKIGKSILLWKGNMPQDRAWQNSTSCQDVNIGLISCISVKKLSN